MLNKIDKNIVPKGIISNRAVKSSSHEKNPSKQSRSVFTAKDRVEISDLAKKLNKSQRLIQKAQKNINLLIESGSGKLDRVQELIKSGHYNSSQVIDGTVDQLLKSGDLDQVDSIPIEQLENEVEALFNERVNKAIENVAKGKYESDKIFDAVAEKILKYFND